MDIFTLNYIFIARINRALASFQDGWNHHGIRTSNHLSPQQLFTQGVLRLHSSGLIALDFLDNVNDDYGVSVNDPMPPLETESVVVPETQFTLITIDFESLKDSVDPLQNSENYGIEICATLSTFLWSLSNHWFKNEC